MRIAFANHSRRKVGGTEVYIGSALSALANAGHEVAWLHESDEPADREPVSCPYGTTTWCISSLSLPTALQQLAHWKPDVIYSHGFADANLDPKLMDIAPSVLYVHNYYGTCISGNKLNHTATPHVCDRKFGAACLLYYFPEHCGGRSPLTMWSQYRQQSQRLESMRLYRGLIANSDYIADELARYSLAAECVYPFTATAPVVTSDAPPFAADPLRLIFAGRMTKLKGGDYLLRAAAEAQRLLGRTLHVTLAGDGPDRAHLEALASRLRNQNLAFDFPGWLSADNLRRAFSQSHLHVLPSIWPEPFGLSGPEAGLLGVPTVAFAVGGIPEWLKDGVNGHLAPAPATASGLAEAIAKALSAAGHYAELRQGACREAHRYSLDDHLARILAIFERCRA